MFYKYIMSDKEIITISKKTLISIVVLGGVLLCLIILFTNVKREKFSTSGLTMDDEYCNYLTSTYKNKDQDLVCGKMRRQFPYSTTGNYYTENGVLV